MWIDDRGAHEVPDDRLDRVLYVGQVSTPELTADERRGPQAYLAVQGAATTPLPVHFHTVDQFQYFAHGAGTVGAHAVRQGVVHYSDALTPYGPLRPGEPGMSYLTLRPVHDGGVQYMPESADELRRSLGASARPPGARRNVAVPLDEQVEVPGAWSVLLDEPDGLRVAVLEAPPAASTPLVTAGRGGYLVVVRGSVVDGDDVHGEGALRWCAPGEELAVVGGLGGARVAWLQYPTPPVGDRAVAGAGAAATAGPG